MILSTQMYYIKRTYIAYFGNSSYYKKLELLLSYRVRTTSFILCSRHNNSKPFCAVVLGSGRGPHLFISETTNDSDSGTVTMFMSTAKDYFKNRSSSAAQCQYLTQKIQFFRKIYYKCTRRLSYESFSFDGEGVWFQGH